MAPEFEGGSRPDVLVAGETLVDFIPDRPGPLGDVERFERRTGGAPANVAVALANLGAPPWLLTRVGADPFGEFLEATLADHSVPDRFVQRDPERRTTLAFVAHDEAADRAFTFYRENAADLHVDTAAVPDGVLDEVSWLYVGGVALTAEPARSATFDLVDRARDRGCAVAFDPNGRPELWDDADAPSVVERMVARASVVKATPDDLAGTPFAAGEAADLAAALAAAGPHTALVTRGEAGALAAATADAPWGPAEATHAGYAVDAVDATGAGDAFFAGALAALIDGDALAEALAFGNAVAALSTTAAGATDALPDRAAVESFRRARE